MKELWRRFWWGNGVNESPMRRFIWEAKWWIRSLYDENYKYFKKHGHWPVYKGSVTTLDKLRNKK